MASSASRWTARLLVVVGWIASCAVPALSADSAPASQPALAQPATAQPAAGALVSHLSAGNLLLIVNQNEPAGMRLATFYAEQRHVPEGRILSIDLPKTDEMPAELYNEKVAPAVRAFLNERHLVEQVTCIVTFYGVPLRVGPRSNSPDEIAEYRQLTAEFDKTIEQVKLAVSTVEDIAKQARPEFKPTAPADRLATRAEQAIGMAIPALAADTDEVRRTARFNKLCEAMRTLFGPMELAQRLAMPAYAKLVAKPMSPAEIAEIQQKINRLVADLQPLGAKAATDADARAKIRAAFAENLGALRTLQVDAEYKQRLETRETEAAVDSELACLWWPDSRARYRWHENPLHYRLRFAAAIREHEMATHPGMAVAQPPQHLPRTLMVMRLDAPTEQRVHEIIATCIEIEKKGLKGNVAIDARGKPPTEAYGVFDELLRKLAADLKEHSKLNITLDNAEPVFQPGAVKDVAAYCGWYSLRHYVPGMTFVPGAVGYHIASGELVALHNPNEKGWVHGLISDGVVATLGPVAEPYLHSFPNPDEFFPLLMTGKLKLAEVYWLTNPLVSWMNTCIGDPLYTPYEKEPPLAVNNLSASLKSALLSTAAAVGRSGS